jgi:hypothetical protein
MSTWSTLYLRGIDIREAAHRKHVHLNTARREYAKAAARCAADAQQDAASTQAAVNSPRVTSFSYASTRPSMRLVDVSNVIVSQTYAPEALRPVPSSPVCGPITFPYDPDNRLSPPVMPTTLPVTITYAP